MKYYEGWEVATGGISKFSECSICKKKSMSHKLTVETKELVCLSCFDKDIEKEEIPYK
jgi:formylmethanofuran dehydrogenase subunit E